MTMERRDADEDPPREAWLGEQLRDAEGAEHERADWDVLRRRIATAARAQHRSSSGPAWHVLARWSSAAVPVAIAAGIAATIAVSVLTRRTERSVAASPSPDSVQMLIQRSLGNVRDDLRDPDSFLSEVISR